MAYNSMPTRVLYVHRCEKISGGNHVLLSLLDKTDRSRIQPWSIVPKSGPLEAELERRQVPYKICDVIGPVTEGGRWSQIKALCDLAQFLVRRRIQLVHANTAAGYHLVSYACRSLGIKAICHLHLRPQISQLRRALRIPPHAVITCSRALLEENRAAFAEICPTTKLRAIPNGVNANEFSPAPPSPRLCSELALREGELVVSIVGQISARKGHPAFLEMAALLRDRFPHARYLVIGSDLERKGEYQREMEALAGHLGVAGVVRFLGFRNDVVDLMRASHVVVLPSVDEGLPLSLLQAAACGKPIVAYRIPGVAEVVHDGRNGCLTEHRALDLAEAVGSVLADAEYRERLGAEGRRMAVETFSLDAQVRSIHDLYDEVLGRDRARSIRRGELNHDAARFAENRDDQSKPESLALGAEQSHATAKSG
jgi:glycosyltransferase involved in cell wall biosynthesis